MAVVRALMCASSSSVGEPSPGFGRVEIFAETFCVLLPFIPCCSSGHVMGSKYLLVT